MTTPTEETLVELPAIRTLRSLGYRVIDPADHPTLRPRESDVLFTPLLVDALMRLNDIDEGTARSLAAQYAAIDDNQTWLARLRNQSSLKPPEERDHRTMRLVDFDDPDNNDFAVTRQLRVRGSAVRKPDLVVYLNGVPVVVIELKSPLSPAQDTFEAIQQIRSAEREVPRLFLSNLFNIASNDLAFRFGATGAPVEFWSDWRDPWPRDRSEFADATARGLYALLEPRRLLDILAHYIVFETRDGKTVKKVCRHQQYRAVSKMAQRVAEGRHRAGLVWHTQGSGKSLTMVFAALKLKLRRGTADPRMPNPDLLVVTDRVALHDQLTKTFHAAGVPNVQSADAIDRPTDAEGRPIHPPEGEKETKVYLREALRAPGNGRVLLSTIFKFHWGDARLTEGSPAERAAALEALAAPGSGGWIVLVDECHRTQEKDLGAYLRAILPDAVRFGFTGTPVEKGDRDTFENFGAPGERYLDKYGIDDAVADGATVPVLYQARCTEWHLHDIGLDVAFDQQFADLPERHLAELRRRGVTKGDVARLESRIKVIALDIWLHYTAHVMPDGYKGQVVAIDRRACVAYKQALDFIITTWLVECDGMGEAEAAAAAKAMSVCVYSPAQHDKEKYPELVAYQLDEKETQRAVDDFRDPSHPLRLLIVCNKLLTGFDAPVEQVMYLDNPLTDHNLLQAVARTNRVFTGGGGRKPHGMVVDYIGVTHKLDAALAAYRKSDVAGALRDHSALAGRLAAAHRACMDLIRQVPLDDDPKADALAIVRHLGSLDRWYLFRGEVDGFVRAYQALAPDSRVLMYKGDLLRVTAAIPYGRLEIEKVEPDPDWKRYSAKVRGMLRAHLEVTGLATTYKVRDLSDPRFMDDFEVDARDEAALHTAAVRKLTELKSITRERAALDPARYGKFSDRVKQLIRDFEMGVVDERAVLTEARSLVDGVQGEDRAHLGTGLGPRAYSIAMILRQFAPAGAEGAGGAEGAEGAGGSGPSALAEAAAAIDALYASDASAPRLWQVREELRRGLRRQVRQLVLPLGLEGWQKRVPNAVEAFALRHYAKEEKP